MILYILIYSVLGYINEAETAGSTILLDGRTWMSAEKPGCWFGPTIILHANSSDPAMQQEIFGPILSVYLANSKEEAIHIENNNPYGMYIYVIYYDVLYILITFLIHRVVQLIIFSINN